MTVEIADTILQKVPVTPSDVKVEIAVALYQRNILTLEQASKLAEKDQLSFQQILGQRGIEVHYDVEDFRFDLETLTKLGRIKL